MPPTAYRDGSIWIASGALFFAAIALTATTCAPRLNDSHFLQVYNRIEKIAIAYRWNAGFDGWQNAYREWLRVFPSVKHRGEEKECVDATNLGRSGPAVELGLRSQFGKGFLTSSKLAECQLWGRKISYHSCNASSDIYMSELVSCASLLFGAAGHSLIFLTEILLCLHTLSASCYIAHVSPDASYCDRCVSLDQECTYPSKRKSTVGKRKQVRDLEEKLAELETRLNNIGTGESERHEPQTILHDATGSMSPPLTLSSGLETEPFGLVTEQDQTYPEELATDPALEDKSVGQVVPDEPIQFELLERLTGIYFDNLHHACPMIHRAHYVSSLQLDIELQPPQCLQYMIMATGASISPGDAPLTTPLYERARALAEADEMKDQRYHPLTVAHVQCWILMSNFEARKAEFSRASLSLGRSIRMAQMLNLHQLDRASQGPSLFPNTLPSPQDWVELEERRRTWWVAYVADHLVFATSGLPAIVDDADVHTALPASDEAFANGCATQTDTVSEALRKREVIHSPLAVRVLAAYLFHQAPKIVPQSTTEEDVSKYWMRHKEIDDNLAALASMLPTTLQLPQGSGCQYAVFINVLINTAAMCLHRTAARIARCRDGPEAILSSGQSQIRMVSSAENVLDIFSQTKDLVMALRNPIQDYAAYIAALAFIEDFSVARNSLSKGKAAFLLNILHTAGHTHAVARMLAAQLTTELEKAGIEIVGGKDVVDLSRGES
ncbi:hypothetical protein NM208_g2950 [Fusarium decemcellulare]|uniref:Uncharacterized protein n=1 Tax=Fusarium decemcellulare TaxID=57161 RepID=A0ACC1SR74_9HYPO|nr:hypothetical protein NM208_g2950 [Fusarium decemcellulare]